jgi:hypothetical protein
MYTISLDCPPGAPRPGDLLPSVLNGIGVVIDPENTVMRFFGCWRWEVPKEYEELYVANRELIAERIKKLYNDGAIRYGDW